MGAPKWPPKPPNVRGAPAEPWHPSKPPTFGAPRHSRVAPLKPRDLLRGRAGGGRGGLAVVPDDPVPARRALELGLFQRGHPGLAIRGDLQIRPRHDDLLLAHTHEATHGDHDVADPAVLRVDQEVVDLADVPA